MTNDPEIILCLTCSLPNCKESRAGCAWARSPFAEREKNRLYMMAYTQRPKVKTKRTAGQKVFLSTHGDWCRQYHREYAARRKQEPGYQEHTNARARENRARKKMEQCQSKSPSAPN